MPVSVVMHAPGNWPSATAASNSAWPVGSSAFTYALTNRATHRVS